MRKSGGKGSGHERGDSAWFRPGFGIRHLILGLEAGADSCVTKPFRFAVLLARIRAQLRRARDRRGRADLSRSGAIRSGQAPRCWSTGRRKNQKVRLTEKEDAAGCP